MRSVLRSSLSLASLLFASAAYAAPETKLLLAGRVLDVRTGHYIADGAVLVVDDRIDAVGTAASIPISKLSIRLRSAKCAPSRINTARLRKIARWCCRC